MTSVHGAINILGQANRIKARRSFRPPPARFTATPRPSAALKLPGQGQPYWPAHAPEQRPCGGSFIVLALKGEHITLYGDGKQTLWARSKEYFSCVG